MVDHVDPRGHDTGTTYQVVCRILRNGDEAVRPSNCPRKQAAVHQAKPPTVEIRMDLPAQIMYSDHGPVAPTERVRQEPVHAVVENAALSRQSAEAAPLVEPELPEGCCNRPGAKVRPLDRNNLSYSRQIQIERLPAECGHGDPARTAQRRQELFHIDFDAGKWTRQMPGVDHSTHPLARRAG